MSMRFVILAAVAALALAGPALAAEKKGPPACAKIEFRPVPSGQNDGEVDAGLYKSRFGKLELRATVKGGEPQDYYLVRNGQKLAPVAGGVPKGVESCAAAKHVPAPTKASEPCTGDRFAALIAHPGKDTVVSLYARSGGQWKFCRAGTIGS